MDQQLKDLLINTFKSLAVNNKEAATETFSQYANLKAARMLEGVSDSADLTEAFQQGQDVDSSMGQGKFIRYYKDDEASGQAYVNIKGVDQLVKTASLKPAQAQAQAPAQGSGGFQRGQDVETNFGPGKFVRYYQDNPESGQAYVNVKGTDQLVKTQNIKRA